MKSQTPYTDRIIANILKLIEQIELVSQETPNSNLLNAEFQAGFRQAKEQILKAIKEYKTL